MPKLPQSAANFYLNRRYRGVSKQQALQEVVQHLRTAQNPEYQAAAPLLEEDLNSAGADDNNLTAIADSLVNNPRLDPDEPPGILPPQPGEVREMQTQSGRQGMRQTVGTAGMIALPAAAGMGAGALAGRMGFQAAAPYISAAAQGLMSTGMELAAGGSPEDAARSGAIMAGANVGEEFAQQKLSQVPIQTAARISRTFGLPTKLLATVSPVVLSALNNIALSTALTGEAPGMGDIGMAGLTALPAVSRVRPGMLYGGQPDKAIFDVGGLPHPSLLAEPGTEAARNIQRATQSPASEDIMRQVADQQQMLQENRLRRMFGEGAPSEQVSELLRGIQQGAAGELNQAQNQADLLNQLRGQRVEEINRGLERSTQQARYSVEETDRLRYETQMAERRAAEARLKAEADATNRANMEAYEAEKAEWNRLQNELKTAETERAIGEQIGVMGELPSGAPATVLRETADITNAPGVIPQEGIISPREIPTPGEMGAGADLVYRKGIQQARDIAEDNIQKAIRTAEEVESRSPTKTIFTPADQQAWSNQLRSIRDRYRTILNSDMGQLGPSAPKIREIADMLDNALSQGGIMTYAGTMKLQRELNKTLKWYGGKIDMQGMPLEVTNELRKSIFNLIENVGPERMPSVGPAASQFKRGRNQYVSAEGAEAALREFTGSKTKMQGLPGDRSRTVPKPAAFGKALMAEGEDPVAMRARFDKHIENILTQTGMGKDALPRLSILSEEFNQGVLEKQVAKIVKPGAEVTEQMADKLVKLRETVKPENVEIVDNAAKRVEGLLNRTSHDPKKAVRNLFSDGEDFSGEVMDSFNRETRPLLDAMDDDTKAVIYGDVLRHRLMKAGADKKVLQQSDIERILADPVVQTAPAHITAALRTLAERKLSGIIMGKIPEFTKTPPTKIEADTAQLGPMPYSPDVAPDVITPKLYAEKVEPAKVPMGKTLLALKDLSKVDGLDALFMQEAMTGVREYGPKFVKKMKAFIGEEGWENLRLEWLRRAATDKDGLLNPAKAYTTLIDRKVPDEIKHSVWFNSADEYQTAVGTLKQIEVPLSQTLRMIRGVPSSTPGVHLRRVAALLQFLKSTGAGAAAGLGLQAVTTSNPALLAGTTALGIYMGYMQPRAFARSLLGQKTSFRRAAEYLDRFNRMGGSAFSRLGVTEAAADEMEPKSRIGRGGL